MPGIRQVVGMTVFALSVAAAPVQAQTVADDHDRSITCLLVLSAGVYTQRPARRPQIEHRLNRPSRMDVRLHTERDAFVPLCCLRVVCAVRMRTRRSSAAGAVGARRFRHLFPAQGP